MAKMMLAVVCCALLLTVLVVGLAVSGRMAEGDLPRVTLAGEGAEVKNVDVGEAYALIADREGDPAFVILDVRTPGEVAAGYIEGAVNINYRNDSFSREISALDRGKTYLVYCRAGNRSARTSEMMVKDGFAEVYNMEGGITAWREAGYPVVRESPA
ncbi:rhodanese-like domain-containing protein [uncultured Methanofollis sp.]|uniref:rhodanese-like domain-containing protein n=1 Tax=uncultured Methanofollis sp. TaxID=262500 RepID=UPI00260BB169|nr:rhodanese-like domain-containing protein [uncultured Methanofollis sp.]